MIDKDALYTARYALLTDSPVPDGAALESLLDVLRPMLGPEPEWYSGAVVKVPLIGVPERADQKAAALDPLKVEGLVGADQRFPMVGYGFTAEEFGRYLAGLDDNHMTWSPNRVTIHHTAAPSLSQRPDGFTSQHMWNLQDYYLNTRGWSRGPHLFVDDNLIWVHTPLTRRGIHAVSFNADSFGVEMLGDFDYKDDPKTGRGLDVVNLAAEATAHLQHRFGLNPGRMNGHRDDPRSSKSCPGKKIDTEWFRKKVLAAQKRISK